MRGGTPDIATVNHTHLVFPKCAFKPCGGLGSGRAEGFPHAPVTGTKAGKPFWDAYPKGGEQRKKLKVLQGANHSGQSFDSEIVLLSGLNPWAGGSGGSQAEKTPKSPGCSLFPGSSRAYHQEMIPGTT